MQPTTIPTPEEALNALLSGYGAFSEHITHHSGYRSLGEAMSQMFLGQGSPRLTAAVEDFSQRLPALVETLKTQLETCPPEQAARLAAQALECMLFYPRPKRNDVECALAAFEGFALPLIPFLAPGQGVGLARRYRTRTPPRRMLPNQTRVFQALSGR